MAHLQIQKEGGGLEVDNLQSTVVVAEVDRLEVDK